MLPLPGPGFFYSLLKDVGRLSLGRLRSRSLPRAEAFRRWTVDQWYPPSTAIREFADQDLARRSDKANQEADLLRDEAMGMTWEQYPEAYKAASAEANDATIRADALYELLKGDLEYQLLNGDLIARGFAEPHSHRAPYLTICRHEWRVIKLEPPENRAAGGGVSYIGVTIGKPGTKRFLCRWAGDR
jgi:hypothetical protein